MKRKLTTILCADAVGFSAMMARDEKATHASLSRHRATMDALFAHHDGRKVNTWGDAVIAEFASVVEAVECAIAIQAAIAEENAPQPGDARLQFRIGINLGDVMVDGGDLIGDGVNIAARLQEVAEPGGIVISRPVFDHVHRHLSTRIEPLPTAVLRNIDAPIDAFRISVDGTRPNPAARADFAFSNPTGEPAAAKGEITTTAGDIVAWYKQQDRRARTGMAIVAGLAAIDFLTSPTALWFFWPAIPILLFAFRPWRQLGGGDNGTKIDRESLRPGR